MVMDMSLLEIRGLETEFQTEQGVVKALRGIDYTVDKGEVLGIVGESGSGKSVGMLSPVSYTHLTLPTNSRV